MNHTRCIQLVEQAANRYMEKVQTEFGYSFNLQIDKSTAKSKTAGKAHIGEILRGQYRITINIPLLALNDSSEQIDTTVGHEIAHLIAYDQYKDKGHGPAWKRVMVRFGLEPKRCHQMDQAAVAAGKNTTQHCYRCEGCNGRFTMGSKRHNRQQAAIRSGRENGVYHHCRHHKLTFVMTTGKHKASEWIAGNDKIDPEQANVPEPTIPTGTQTVGTQNTGAQAAAQKQGNKRASTNGKQTKIDMCRKIYGDYKFDNRSVIIGKFVNDVGCTKAQANTYYSKIKKEFS